MRAEQPQARWIGALLSNLWNGKGVNDATRELFGNPNPYVGDGIPGQYPILVTVGWMVVLLAIFAPLAIRKYRNTSQ